MSEAAWVGGAELWLGDCRDVLATMPADSVHCCVTSPPYAGLRDYGHPDQIGLEPTVELYVAELVKVFREVRRVLRADGTLWLVLGDFHRDKQLVGAPWRVAFALQADGWWLRSDIVWAKPNPMPESVQDRPTRSHEYVFLLSKSASYYFDADAVAEPSAYPGDARELGRDRIDRGDDARGRKGRMGASATRNVRSVWTIATQPFSGTTETVRRVRVEGDAPCDGKKRTTSRDCPLHGDRAGRAPMASDGGRAGGGSSRSGRSDVRPGPGPPGGSAPIGPSRDEGIAAESSRLPLLPCSPSAIAHSSEMSRTAHAPATNPAYTPSAQSQTHIGDSAAERGSSAPHDCTDESNSGSDGSACSADHQTESRTSHRSGGQGSSSPSHGSRCSCEYYVEIAEKTSHFAVMPAALAERCIKAGTSERGCCPACKAPWTRVVERERAPDRPNRVQARDGDSIASAHGQDGRAGNRYVVSTQTTGWRPSCACDAGEPVPCTVLDQFAGAGTTLLVAERLQRRSIGIELNPAYVEMAARRLRDDASLFAAPPGPAPGREEIAASVAEDQKILL